jgi:hypothetical protein
MFPQAVLQGFSISALAGLAEQSFEQAQRIPDLRVKNGIVDGLSFATGMDQAFKAQSRKLLADNSLT